MGNIPITYDPIRSPVSGHDVCGIRNQSEEQLAGDVVNTRQSQSPGERLDVRQLGIQLYSGPKNPNMASEDIRKNSFINWILIFTFISDNGKGLIIR